jgi:hypothetical protein
VQLRPRPEPADRAGVDAAPRHLERLDDLHRAQLRRARDAAARERRAQQLGRRDAGAQLGLDGREQVVHLRIARVLGERPDPHAARARDLAEVVAQQVDDHRELGEVLLAREQLLEQPRVVARVPAARARALDRPRAHAVAAAPEELLRRRRHHRRAGAVLEVGRERRRAQRAQPHEQLARVAREARRERLREVDLEHVAAADVLDDRRHGALVLRAREVRPQVRHAAHRRRLARRSGVVPLLAIRVCGHVHERQRHVVPDRARQRLDRVAQVVAEPADRAVPLVLVEERREPRERRAPLPGLDGQRAQGPREQRARAPAVRAQERERRSARRLEQRREGIGATRRSPREGTHQGRNGISGRARPRHRTDRTCPPPTNGCPYRAARRVRIMAMTPVSRARPS